MDTVRDDYADPLPWWWVLVPDKGSVVIVVVARLIATAWGVFVWYTD
jgi:hypothetical protein